MTSALITALIEKKAFVEDTIVTAIYQSLDAFGRSYSTLGKFKVKKILNNTGGALFELSNLSDTTTVINAYADSIQSIDGMNLSRFADIYDLLPDGTNKKVGRKRGRKSKNQLTF